MGFTGPYWALQCLIGRYLALEGLIEPSFQYGRKGKKKGGNFHTLAESPPSRSVENNNGPTTHKLHFLAEKRVGRVQPPSVEISNFFKPFPMY